MSTTFTHPDDRWTLTSALRLPFLVRYMNGSFGRDRHFGSLGAAQKALDGTCQIFFEYAQGCGRLIERHG